MHTSLIRFAPVVLWLLVLLPAHVSLATPGVMVEEAADEILQLARSIDPLVGGEADGLQSVHDKLLAFNEKSPTNASRYALAYCRYRMATLQFGGGDPAKNAELLKAAQKDLEMVIETAPARSEEAAEAMGLLSGIMGFRIGMDPGLSMSLGPRSGQLISKAARMAPDNPRVKMQEGISKFNTPKMFGGSIKKAETLLREAVSIFADQAGNDQPEWPSWGYLDTLAWLGQALAAQDKTAEARAVYQQALAINPEMGWIRYQLLPALGEQ